MVESGERSDDAPTAASSEAREGRRPYLVGHADSSELARVLQRIDSPLVVHDETGMIRLANQAAADIAGVSLDELVGTPVTQLVSPVDLVEDDVADLVAGRFEGFSATREVTPRGGHPIPVYAVAYAIEVDGQRFGVGMCVAQSELGRLGRNLVRFSNDLVPVALGLARADWTIESISREVNELIGRQPSECVGARLVDMIHPDDAADLKDQLGRAPAAPFVLPQVRFTTRSDQWIHASVLVAPFGEDSARIRFALVGQIDDFPRTVGHDQALELRLRRIGLDLRAAGMITSMTAVPALDDIPRMGELTSRQWEILNRLLRGERVSTIAKALFISPSTVRNHLSAIFEKFGVHSQVELIEHLRAGDW